MSSEIRLRSEWLSLLKGQFEQPYMSRLSAFLRAEKAAGKTIYPPAGQFFAALEATPPEALLATAARRAQEKLGPLHGKLVRIDDSQCRA